MEKKNKDDETKEIEDFIRQLLEKDELPDPVEGITKRALDIGLDKLVGQQRPTIDRFINNYRDENVCEICSNGNVGALSDYIYINENGICPMCQHDKDKFMAD